MLPAAALPQAAKKPVFSQNTWRIGFKKGTSLSGRQTAFRQPAAAWCLSAALKLYYQLRRFIK